MFKDVFISDFEDVRFQTAFMQYFKELGIDVSDWNGLWQEMNHDPNAENHAFVRLDEDGSIIGFIQFCEIALTSWFFEENCGFIREFWIRKDVRKQGHGSALIMLAENQFRMQGIGKCILTTDTAPDFYKKHGYHHDANLTARNKDKVYVKTL